MLNLIHDQVFSRLDHVTRFNGTPVTKQETVSQHSYWVTFFTSLLMRDIFYLALYSANKEALYYRMYNYVLRAAIHHDNDEIFHSDIVWDTKYHPAIGSEIKESLEKIYKHEIKKAKGNIFIDELIFVNHIDENGDPIVGLEQRKVCLIIVKISDWLSCYAYCYGEYRLGNKQEKIISIMDTCKIELKKILCNLLDLLNAIKLPYSNAAIEKILL